MNKIENIYKIDKLYPPDLNGWNFKHQIFDDLVEQVRPKVIIEVGTWKGASALRMARACKRLGLNTKIYCVDTWLGAVEFWTDLSHTPERDLMLVNGYPQIYYQFLSNVIHEGFTDMIIPIPNTSATGAKILKHLGVVADLIYIDGSHEYEDVKSDIDKYMTLLNWSGVMFGDDYGWADVKKAVDETGLKTEIVDQNFWVYGTT